MISCQPHPKLTRSHFCFVSDSGRKHLCNVGCSGYDRLVLSAAILLSKYTGKHVIIHARLPELGLSQVST